jgi:hypothetical protein
MLTKKDYQNAIDVQNACNASGVANSLKDLFSKIWEEARELGQGTHYVNTHPAVVMFVHKLCDLSGVNGDTYSFEQAYMICEDRAANLRE